MQLIMFGAKPAAQHQFGLVADPLSYLLKYETLDSIPLHTPHVWDLQEFLFSRHIDRVTHDAVRRSRRVMTRL